MIDDLNRTPDHVIETARGLDFPARLSYLVSEVTRDNRAFLHDFVREVIVGGEPAATWRRGRVLVPSGSLRDLLTKRAEDIVGPLAALEGVRWHQLNFGRRRAIGQHVGAPAAVLRQVNYRWRVPKGTLTVRVAESYLVPVTDLVVAVRRWLAYRSALTADFAWDRLTSVDSIVDAVGIPAAELSADAIIAMQALAAEAAMESPPDSVAGFRGPDSLYRA
jgi:hypothetical protein